jgi:WD40 repeat protein
VALAGPTYEIVTAPLPGGAAGPLRNLPEGIYSRVFEWLDGDRLLVGDNTGRLLIWDDRASRADPIDAYGVNIDALACTFGARPRAVVCAGKVLWLYDLAADGTPRPGRRRVVELPPETGTVRVVAWSPDGTGFVIGTNTGEVERFDAATGLSLGSFARHAREVTSLAWSPAGRTLVSCDAECVRLSDVRTTAVFDEYRPGWTIESVRLDVRDGAAAALVVAGNEGGAGRIAVAELGAR